MAVLTVLTTLVVWGLLALGVAGGVHLPRWSLQVRFAGRAAVFAMTSFSVRECWQVMVSTLHALIVRHNIKSLQEQQEASAEPSPEDDDDP